MEYFLLGRRRESSSDFTSRVMENLMRRVEFGAAGRLFAVMKATINYFELSYFAWLQTF